MAPMPKWLATLRMESASRPSASAMATPASTTSARLVRGRGPRPAGGGGGFQSRSTTRRPSGVPTWAADCSAAASDSVTARSSFGAESFARGRDNQLRTVYDISIRYGVRSYAEGWQMIHTESLRKHFVSKKETVEAVKGVDIDVAPGELVAFLGPNGAGKSTTLRMLTTLLPPKIGRAHV